MDPWLRRIMGGELAGPQNYTTPAEPPNPAIRGGVRNTRPPTSPRELAPRSPREVMPQLPPTKPGREPTPGFSPVGGAKPVLPSIPMPPTPGMPQSPGYIDNPFESMRRPGRRFPGG